MSWESNRCRRSIVAALSALALLTCAVDLRSMETTAGDSNSKTKAAQTTARQILEATGVRGGLIVHVGCGDGRLTAALRANDSYLVHGLTAEAGQLETAREQIRSLDLYGKVSVERWTGKRLPYVDNLVNLLVSEDLGEVLMEEVPMEEVLRVLAPNGVAYVKQGDNWAKTVKPWPKEIDEWTHYMHDASGNAVAHDSVVGPPRHLQWVGSPRWSRHHDHVSSVSAVVSAGGRVFYIFDEGPAASIQLPPRWSLIARDAFNGTILWKRPINLWHNHRWPLKSGPAHLPRRLVAVGQKVYVALGMDAPLRALDAATGKTIHTYEASQATEEVIASEGVLFLMVNDSPTAHGDYRPIHPVCWDETARVARERPWDGRKRSILAVEADSGKTLWRQEYPVVPLTLAAVADNVFFHDGAKIVCLDRTTGERHWSSAAMDMRSPVPSSFAPTLVAYGDVVLFSGGKRSMAALSAENGETLWTAKHPRSGHHSPEDLLVVDGLVWSGATAGGRDSGVFKGRDPLTGEVKLEFPPDVETYWFHHRCYRAKATDRYLLPSRTGLEFVDFREKHWIVHHWVRGGCVYGIMPCNGLIYAPPHPCACYLESKLNGFCVLAPGSASPRIGEDPQEDARLEKGPAFGQEPAEDSELGTEDSEDWPTYRHDPSRSGSTKASVAAALKRSWQTDLGGRLSSVVVAGGKVFVAEVDAHTVHALDANSGSTLWSYTAAARVDSPPTVHGGRVLFGSADGRVYCLRASDGELIWRFRAAPEERRATSFEQVESVWPVHGSVLVLDDVVHCVAGRSMFLDGGMRLLRLDVATGRKLSETILDDRDPTTGEDLQAKTRVLNMPVALPDILSSDGQSVYMRSQRFDLEGNRQEIPLPAANPAEHAASQDGEGVHLFSPTGFLDDSWWHRSYWLFGKTFSSGCNWWFRAGRFVPAGRLLVFDESRVYGFGRKPQLFCWTPVLEYHLYAADKQINAEPLLRVKEASRQIESNTRSAIFNRNVTKLAAPADISAVRFRWSHEDPPLQVRAMVLARDILFVAGPPDVVDEEEALRRPFDAEIRAKLDEQTAALEGKRGALFWALSTSDGQKLAQYDLESPPVWDGMAAAAGCLYVATVDGKVACFAPGGELTTARRTLSRADRPGSSRPRSSRGRPLVSNGSDRRGP